MINIAQRISVIEALLEEASEASLTYAALECRLTIEQVCYDRLKMSYAHISYDELAKWQPKHVVQQVVNDANTLAASGFTLSISKEPVPSDEPPLTREEFEAREYIQIGEQAALNLSKLGKLWNALSRVALHSRLPADKSDEVRSYGNPADIKRQVTATLVELEKLKSGTLLSSALGENYFFPCATCGTEIRRIKKLLRHGQVVNCVNPHCKESYQIHKEGEEIFYVQRTASTQCDGCGAEVAFPQRLVDDLKQSDQLDVPCQSCGHINLIRLMPMLVRRQRQECQDNVQS